MKILLDMNLPPSWVGFLQREGFEAVHWSTVGDPRSSDASIMAWARENDFVVFSHDLDFSALLAATQAIGPSVVPRRWYDGGMTAAKIAITIPPEQLARVRRAVRSGHAESVSGYIARVLEEHQQHESLQKLVADLIEEHGMPTKREEAWARRVLARRRRA